MEISAKNLVLAAAAAFAAVAAFCLLRSSEESKVKAAFERAADTISKKSDESLIVAAAKSRSIADLADDKISISFPEEGVVNARLARNEMAQQMTLVRNSCSSLSIAFESVKVVSIEGGTAHATADLLVSGSGSMSFLEGRDTREVEADLVKSPDDGKWRFSNVTVKPIVSL